MTKAEDNYECKERQPFFTATRIIIGRRKSMTILILEINDDMCDSRLEIQWSCEGLMGTAGLEVKITYRQTTLSHESWHNKARKKMRKYETELNILWLEGWKEKQYHDKVSVNKLLANMTNGLDWQISDWLQYSTRMMRLWTATADRLLDLIGIEPEC